MKRYNPAKPKTHIYYCRVYELASTRLIDERVSFHYQQYNQLIYKHGEEQVECKRMDMATGKWEPYPANGD